MQTFQELLSRYPALNVTLIVLWAVLLVGRFVGGVSQSRLWRRLVEYLRTPPDSWVHRTRVTGVNMLRPVRQADGSVIRRTSRVPLEYNLGHSRLRNVRVWRRALFLGPSSPKPAFTISRLEVIREQEFDISACASKRGGDHVSGGYRLKIWLCRGESPRHFVRTLRSGMRSDKRMVAVCSPEEIGQRRREASYYCVYPPSSQPAGEEYPCVTLYSSDPLFSGRAHHDTRSLDRTALDIVWLVLLGSDDPNESAEQHARELSDPELCLHRFPKPFARRIIFGITALTAVVIVLRSLLIHYFGYGSEIGQLWTDTLAVVALVYFGVPLTLLSILRHSLFEYRESRSRAARSFWYEDVSVDQLGRPSWRRFRKRMWTASTTNCIADGFTIRNRAPR